MSKILKIKVDLKSATGVEGGDEPVTMREIAAKLENRVDSYIDEFISLNASN